MHLNCNYLILERKKVRDLFPQIIKSTSHGISNVPSKLPLGKYPCNNSPMTISFPINRETGLRQYRVLSLPMNPQIFWTILQIP